jgi:hypothetical protein
VQATVGVRRSGNAARSKPLIGRAALRNMAKVGQTVKLVWKRQGRREIPWVFVAPSEVRSYCTGWTHRYELCVTRRVTYYTMK